MKEKKKAMFGSLLIPRAVYHEVAEDKLERAGRKMANGVGMFKRKP